MRIEIEPGVRLFVDVSGQGLVPAGTEMAERPTLLLLHGGPGADHSSYKPTLDPLSDVAQLVYYDHRGNGRSDPRPKSEWNLKTWSADVGRVIDALGLDRPILVGLSFGGFVAQSFASLQPDRVAGMILISTIPFVDLNASVSMFGQLGGDQAAEAALAALGPGATSSPEVRERFFKICGPLYTQSGANVFGPSPVLFNHEMAQFFIRGERQTMDLRDGLANVTAPTLILAGSLDPVTPASGARAIRDALGSDHVEYVELDGCGHGTHRDRTEETLAAMRSFVESVSRGL
jgi:pimeloyl-ACP methyl ester carboxylesterase